MIWIKKGNLVEYTDNYHWVYPPEDESLIKFGICVQDSNNLKEVLVENQNGKREIAHHVHAYGWMGWIPEGLEEIHHKIYMENNPNESNYLDEFDDQ